jgi:hypothetical protein
MKQLLSLLLTSMFLLLALPAKSQSDPPIPLERIYEYDASGNRTYRAVLDLGETRSMQSLEDTTDMDNPELQDSKKEVVYTEKVGNIQLTVFPNPTTQMVTIRIQNYADFKEGTLRLYTPDGRFLQQYPILSSEFTIDLSEHVQGVYLLRLQMNQYSDTWKIIKQ